MTLILIYRQPGRQAMFIVQHRDVNSNVSDPLEPYMVLTVKNIRRQNILDLVEQLLRYQGHNDILKQWKIHWHYTWFLYILTFPKLRNDFGYSQLIYLLSWSAARWRSSGRSLVVVSARFRAGAGCADGRHVGEGHFHRVLDGVKQLDDHVRHVAERQLPALTSAGSGSGLSYGAAHLQRVEQQRLLSSPFLSKNGSKRGKRNKNSGRGEKGAGFRLVSLFHRRPRTISLMRVKAAHQHK